MRDASSTPLAYLAPGWFSVTMGLCGLALAWFRSTPLTGSIGARVALAIGTVAGLVLMLLLTASAVRLWRHPAAWREDLRHPVRHTFVATLSASLVLASAVGVALTGPHAGWAALWALGCAAQLAVTAWVTGRWWRAGSAGWSSVTPVLIIPVVGNVLVPLAGVPLGYVEWSWAQFGIGAFFWPVVVGLIAVRLLQQGPWPDRLLPTACIVVAPPAAIGLAVLQLGAAPAVGWACWGVALFSCTWVLPLVPRIVRLPFGLSHWALSFPLAAFAGLTLRLVQPGSVFAWVGLLLLAVASSVIAWLAASTLRGLWAGTLLVPEPAPAPPAATSASQASQALA